MGIIRNLSILLLIFSIGAKCEDNSLKFWDLNDLENIDTLISSWLNYGRQIYYRYQLEVETMYCVTKGIWKITRDHIIEQSKINPSTSIKSKPIEGSISENKTTTEERNTLAKILRRKRNTKESADSQRTVGTIGLASLLGITSKQFSRDHNPTVVRVKKSVNSRTWNDNAKIGDLERSILRSLATNNPMINVFLNIFGNIIYLIHSLRVFMKSSVVLTCISDYAVTRGTEYMYMNI